MEKLIVGKCPLCGGNVVKTCKGFRCENGLSGSDGCKFAMGSLVCNRQLSDNEAAELLSKHKLLLDGFATNEHKQFTSVLVLDNDGSTRLDSKIGKCPACGGDVYVGAKSISCSNYRREGNPCKFVIWRNYGGHMVSLDEAQELLSMGITSNSITIYGEDGSPYEKRLGLSSDKLQIVKF